MAHYRKLAPRLVGARYGRLRLLRKQRIDGATWWDCICDCGRETRVRDANVAAGRTRSCGCSHQEPQVLARTKASAERILVHEGRRQNVSEWSRELGIARSTIYYRLDKGWKMTEVLRQQADGGSDYHYAKEAE